MDVFMKICFILSLVIGICSKLSQGYEPSTDNGTFISNNASYIKTVVKTKIFDLKLLQNYNMDDIKDDPSLMPLSEVKHLLWKKIEVCSNATLDIIIVTNSSSLSIIINKKAFNMSIGRKKKMKNGAYYTEDEGLLLFVINGLTCKVTFLDLFSTNDFGIYRNLIRAIDTVQDGRLIILVSLHDGSLLLHKRARDVLSSLGSLWIDDYSYRDSWMLSFVKGGKTLMESIVPNLNSTDESGSPNRISFQMEVGSVIKRELHCNWPQTEENIARETFCQEHDGYKTLCVCDNPLNFSSQLNETSDNKIPIVILSGNRPLLLYRLLETLDANSEIRKETLLIIMDNFQKGVAKLCFILGIKFLIHKKEGHGGTSISRNLRFALFNGMKEFPKADALIILEDDLVVSPDFYSYMEQIKPIFHLDKTVFCASGFNMFSYPHTSKDATLLYRGKNHPTLGWMMPTAIIREILPKWLPAELYHNWDFFMASNDVIRGRDCVYPDVIRTNHISNTAGTHFPAGWITEKHYLSKNMNEKSNVTLQPLNRLLKENYKEEMLSLLKSAEPVQIKRLLYQLPKNESKLYAIYLNGSSTDHEENIQVLFHKLGVWNGKRIEVITYPRRLHYYNHTLFVVSMPSQFKIDLPEDYIFFEASPDEWSQMQNEEWTEMEKLPVQTHQMGHSIPHS